MRLAILQARVIHLRIFFKHLINEIKIIMKNPQSKLTEVIHITITKHLVNHEEVSNEDNTPRKEKHYTDFISYLHIDRSSYMGENIENLRRSHAWSLEDLAKISGVSLPTLNKYENMIEGNVCKLTFKKVAKVLGVSFIDLLNDKFNRDRIKVSPW